MTFRVKPVDRGRSSRDPSRRTLYMNIAFGITVIVAILILVIVGATTWYNAHLAAAARVDGQTITKDQFVERGAVEFFRISQLEKRIKAEVDAGRLTAAQGESQTASIDNQLDDSKGAFTARIIEKLIDTTLQAKFAAELGAAPPTPEQIDQRILDEKTRKEERHVWLIAVAPELDTGQTKPTDAQKEAAREKAEGSLAAIKGGKAFEDEAKSGSTDASSATGGDLGFLDSTATEDPDWQAAVFKLPVNGLTDVILGADGTYRIGRVTEIVPAQVDALWDQKLADAKISQAAYRTAIASEVMRTILGDRIVADASASGPEKQVQELYIKAPASAPGDGALKVRHILYSPKGDPAGAKDVPATDPSWAEAQAKAQAAYDKIKADPKQFDIIARAESDETQDRGDDGSGGKLPYFDATSGYDEAFTAAVFQEGLKPGDLIAPVKSAFGWHVIQIMYAPPDADEMAKLKTQAAAAGADFGQLARDFSDGPKAGKGGDIGWVHQGQLDDRLTKAILATPIGSITDVIEVPGDGLYLFKVNGEKTAVPDADQLATIKTNAFANWYNGKKAAATITRDLLTSSG